jgi:tRNA U34 2-thiouridine synthase MnmA/TrmU
MAVKALALVSGGLDSSLAVKLIKEQGIEVEGVSFTSPFFGPENAKKAAEELGIKLHIRDVSSEILEIVKNPRYGYGKNINPCIDCHILMAKKAKELMEKLKASFIISGEVVGQRSRSQNKQVLEAIAKRADILGKLLRPLSAKLLPITDPEKRGSINREKLLALSGKSRKPQLELVRRYNLKEYSAPAGGCLLTDSIFSRRLKDLLDHNEYTVNNILFLKLGRHFRSSAGSKIVIGRNKEENKRLKALALMAGRRSSVVLKTTSDKRNERRAISEFTSFNVIGHKGPLAIVQGNLDTETLGEAASLSARYSDGKESPRVKVSYKRLPDGEIKSIIVTPVDASKLGITRI